MKSLLAVFACVAAFVCLPSSVQAAPAALDPGLLQDTRRMMEAMQVRELTLLSMRQTEELIPGQIATMVQNLVQNDQGMSAEQKQNAMQHIGELTQAIAGQVRGMFADPALIDQMVADMEPLYAQAYTRTEMRQLTAFYRSPLGRKMLAAMPKLMAGGAEICNRYTLPRMEKLVQQMVATLEEKFPPEAK